MRQERGFTIVEMLVMLTVFSALATGVYGVMLSVSRGSEQARTVAGISESARLGFNRMVRDTREGNLIDSVAADRKSFEVHVDFDGNSVITPLPGTNSSGDVEELTYSFDEATNSLRLNGEILLKGVRCVTDGAGNCLPPFNFGSNRLEFDTDKNGVTSWEELDAAPATYGVGNGDGQLNWELPLISNVSFAIRVTDDGVTSDYYGEAQLRNQR